MEAEFEGARDSLGNPGKQDIELTRLKCGQTLLRRRRCEFNLVGVVEDSDCQSPAELNKEPLPFPIAVGSKKARRRSHTHFDRATLLNLVQSARLERLPLTELQR